MQSRPDAPTQPTPAAHYPGERAPDAPKVILAPSDGKPIRIRRRWRLFSAVITGLFLGLALGLYLLAPIRFNVLLLGIDRAPDGTSVARSDTMILTTFVPLRPYIGMLSIPRDLWVSVPGHGGDRINTAHFFAESEAPGSGPEASVEVVRLNFGVDIDAYARIRFEGLQQFVDALGGVEVVLTEPMAGYSAGEHVLNGKQALAFVRDREGSDDFFRMAHGQLFLKAVFRQMLRPLTWPRLPEAFLILGRSVDSDIPLWQWPRLFLALLRAGPEGMDFRVIGREMVRPFTTVGGANVLAPDWPKINPVLMEMFGQ